MKHKCRRSTQTWGEERGGEAEVSGQVTLLPTGDHSLSEGRPVCQCVWMFAVQVRAGVREGTCCRGDGGGGGNGGDGGSGGQVGFTSDELSSVQPSRGPAAGSQRKHAWRLSAFSPTTRICSSPGWSVPQTSPGVPHLDTDPEVLERPGTPSWCFFFCFVLFFDPNLKKATSCVLTANKSYGMRAGPPRDDWCLWQQLKSSRLDFRIKETSVGETCLIAHPPPLLKLRLGLTRVPVIGPAWEQAWLQATAWREGEELLL